MRTTFFAILAIAIYGCGYDQPDTQLFEEEELTQAQIDSVLTEFNFEYTNPVFIDSSDHVLLPITTRLIEKRAKYSSDGYWSEDYPRYWNILFYDRSNGETKLLTENKIRVSDYSINIKGAGTILQNRILYRIADTDFNNDQKLSGDDPEHLFISKTDGTGLKRLSPLNENIESYTIVPNTDQLIVRTKRDVNGDLKFDREDEAVWYRIDLQSDSIPVEMVDSLDRKRIENLYFKQWLIKK